MWKQKHGVAKDMGLIGSLSSLLIGLKLLTSKDFYWEFSEPLFVKHFKLRK